MLAIDGTIRRYLGMGLLIMMVFATSLLAKADQAHHQHAFLILGEKNLHLYHLAKFDSPHRYQAFLRVTIRKADGQTLAFSLADSKKVWSLLSTDSFAMADLLARRVTSFTANVLEGYIRQGNARIAYEGVKVQIENIPYAKELVADDDAAFRYRLAVVCDSAASDLYGGVYYAAHVVTSKPGFEQIIRGKALYEAGAAAGEDGPASIVYPCVNAHQGSIWDVYNGAYPNDHVLNEDYIFSRGLSVYSSYLLKNLSVYGDVMITDEQAINRPWP